jgi:hypothetical protein
MPSPPLTSPYAPGPNRMNDAFRIADLIRQQGYSAAEQKGRRGSTVADLILGGGEMILGSLDRREQQRAAAREAEDIAALIHSGNADLGAIIKRVGVERAKVLMPLIESSLNRQQAIEDRKQALADKQLAASDKANERGMWQMSADALRQPGADRYAIQDQYFGQTGKTLPMSDLVADPKVAEAERQRQNDNAMILRSGDALKRPGANPMAINQELWQETGGRETIPKELLPPEPKQDTALTTEDIVVNGRHVGNVLFNSSTGKYLSFATGEPIPIKPGDVITKYVAPTGSGGDAGDEEIKWTDAAIDQAAADYATTGILPALGQGKNAAATKTKIANRKAELFPDADMAGNRAAYIANRSNLTQLVKMRGAIGAFEATAQKNIDLFLDQARKVADSGIPILNAPVRWVTGNIMGSQEQASYAAARLVALAEMSRVTSNPNLTGVVAEKSRDEMREILAGRATLAQTIASIETLKKDMANRIVSIEDEIKEAQAATRSTLAGARTTTGTEGDTTTPPPPPPRTMAPIAPISSSPRLTIPAPTPRPPAVAIPAPREAVPTARQLAARIPGKIYVIDPNGDDRAFDTQAQADNFKALVEAARRGGR